MGFALHVVLGSRTLAGRLASLALALVPILSAAESTEGKATNAWEHYQVIVDKNPFGKVGPEPVGVTPDFAKNMRLCMLSKIPDVSQPGRSHIQAGFVGPAPTNQFTLMEGELTEDGFSLEVVNYAEQSVKLRRGVETAVFTVEGLPVPANLLTRVPPMMGPTPQLPPDAWKIYHEAHKLPSGEIIPPHVHMPGFGEGPNNRVYLTDDQTQEFRRLRAQNQLQPNMPSPR